jgi:hypothetical protein
MDHFKPESGYKAYSYCGTICKNYLIYKINQFSKRQKRNASYDDMEGSLSENQKYSYNAPTEEGNFVSDLMSKAAQSIKETIDEKEKNRLNENEIKVGQALVSLMTNWDNIFAEMGSNKFNKSSILLFLKETTLLNTKEIRDSMKKYKSIYYAVKKNMLDDIYS